MITYGVILLVAAVVVWAVGAAMHSRIVLVAAKAVGAIGGILLLVGLVLLVVNGGLAVPAAMALT